MNTSSEKTVFVLRQNIRWAIFTLLRNLWSAALQACVPLMRRGDSQMASSQRITAGAEGCPIQAISRCLPPVLICETLCNKITLPCLLAHSGRFSINAWFKLIIVDDSVIWVGSSSSNACNSSSSHFCLSHWNRHF